MCWPWRRLWWSDHLKELFCTQTSAAVFRRRTLALVNKAPSLSLIQDRATIRVLLQAALCEVAPFVCPHAGVRLTVSFHPRKIATKVENQSSMKF